jgi:signal transduction histidine kinase
LAQTWEKIGLALGKVAHDLANILTGVNGFAELALSQVAGQSLPEAYLREVCESGQRGVTLAQRMRLLKHCAIVSPHATTTSVALAVETALAEVSKTVTPCPRIQPRLAVDLADVRLGPEALRTVVVEIVRNACEAAGMNGEVHITGENAPLSASQAEFLVGSAMPGRFARLIIEDNGRGIPAEHLAKILTVPLFTTKSGARGFGIPIVFRTLYAHGASFTIGAREPHGTTVELWLPAVEAT